MTESLTTTLHRRNLRRRMFSDRKSFSLNIEDNTGTGPGQQPEFLSDNDAYSSSGGHYDRDDARGNFATDDYLNAHNYHHQQQQQRQTPRNFADADYFGRTTSSSGFSPFNEAVSNLSQGKHYSGKPLLAGYKESFSERDYRTVSEPDLTIRLKRTMAAGQTGPFQYPKLTTSIHYQQQQQQQQQFFGQQQGVSNSSRYVIALYDYNPVHESPNPSGASDELSFRKGSMILVHGGVDEDGFYYGQLDGRRGLVPSNLVIDSDMNRYGSSDYGSPSATSGWHKYSDRVSNHVHQSVDSSGCQPTAGASKYYAPNVSSSPQNRSPSVTAAASVVVVGGGGGQFQQPPAGFAYPSSRVAAGMDGEYYRQQQQQQLVRNSSGAFGPAVPGSRRQSSDFERWARNSSDPLLSRTTYTPPEYQDPRYYVSTFVRNRDVVTDRDRYSIGGGGEAAGLMPGGRVSYGYNHRRRQQFGQKSVSLDIDPESDGGDRSLLGPMGQLIYGSNSARGVGGLFGARRISYGATTQNVPYNSPALGNSKYSVHHGERAYDERHGSNPSFVYNHQQQQPVSQSRTVSAAGQEHHGSLPRLNRPTPVDVHAQNFRQMSLSHDQDQYENGGTPRGHRFSTDERFDSPRRPMYGGSNGIGDGGVDVDESPIDYYGRHGNYSDYRKTTDFADQNVPSSGRDVRHRRSFRKDGRDALQKNMKTMMDETSTPRKVIAKFNYDPKIDSPNPNSEFDELKFNVGDIIAIYGEMDEDGFYVGQLEGRVGLVPSNFLHMDAVFEQVPAGTPPLKKTLPATPSQAADVKKAEDAPPSRASTVVTTAAKTTSTKSGEKSAISSASTNKVTKKTSGGASSKTGAATSASEKRVKTMKKAESIAVSGSTPSSKPVKKHSTSDAAPIKKLSSAAKSSSSLLKKS